MQMSNPNVQAVALSMKDTLGTEYNVISSTPQWHIGEGATENVIVCNKTFAPPELYAEFFTDFVKSYEVRGYKP